MAHADVTAANYGIYPQTAKTATAVTTAANADLSDAPDNTVVLLTMGANGGEVTRLVAIPRATCAATVGHLYLSKDTGATQRLINAAAIAADTISATDAPAQIDCGYSEDAPLRLGAGDALYVGTSVALAAGFVWFAEYREF